jgi:hypothetical protein
LFFGEEYQETREFLLYALLFLQLEYEVGFFHKVITIRAGFFLHNGGKYES